MKSELCLLFSVGRQVKNHSEIENGVLKIVVPPGERGGGGIIKGNVKV